MTLRSRWGALLLGAVLATDAAAQTMGTLSRTTAMDFCETKGKTNPNDDERVYCVATLTGSAHMRVNLEVYGEADRGALLKAVQDTGATTNSVTGNCDPAETSEIRSDYPGADDGGGGSPNGQPIEDTRSPVKFVAGGLARLRVGYYPPAGPKGGWALRVIRKIR